MAVSTKSIVLLSVIGAFWYASLVALIVSMSEYPGSHQLRDYKLYIFIVLLFLSACFRQTYVIWKRGQPESDD